MLVTAIIALSVIVLGLTLVVRWVLKDMGRMIAHTHTYTQAVSAHVINFHYPGAKDEGISPSEQCIQVTSDQPFDMLVGFTMTLPFGFGRGYYCYGAASAVQDGQHFVARIGTYLGKGSAEFKFLCTAPAMSIERLGPANEYELQGYYPRSHWQKMGIGS